MKPKKLRRGEWYWLGCGTPYCGGNTMIRCAICGGYFSTNCACGDSGYYNTCLCNAKAESIWELRPIHIWWLGFNLVLQIWYGLTLNDWYWFKEQWDGI